MRPSNALISVAALALALGGCDKQSGQVAQGEGNNAVVFSGGFLNKAEVVGPGGATSDEVPSTGTADSVKSSAESGFKHVVDRSHKGEAMPDISFTGLGDKPTTLAKEAGGKPFIVNLWATWCVPCIAELPELDSFAGAAAAKGVKLIAVSQDQEGAKQVDPFLAKRKFANLKRYLDPETGLGFAYQANLPTTVLYDAKGKEVARVIGALAWNGPEAQALLKEIGG
ncbi:MAG: TlpA family protein disulfide reductase [Sphingobium sp.]|nr:TlpA family protein disulfide reductase [Sphingobium sp.]